MRGARWPLRGLGHLAAAATWGFPSALDAPEAAQARVARRIARDHARTALGARDGVRGPDDLDRVPPRGWEELEPWVRRQLGGEPGAITPYAVVLREPTSGSQAARKLIPYTRPLLRVFARMFLIWIADLLRHGPPLRSGRFYMSVSPRLTPVDEDAGPPIGLQDDTAYLDGWMRPIVQRFLVRPREAEQARSPEAFRAALAHALLAAPDLEAISVWNPSFLSVLLDHIEAHRDDLATALSPGRREALLADPPRWATVWPRLQLLSCWADGHAHLAATALATRLAHASLQPKGLLATESPVTVPMVGASAGVPLVDRVLIELLDDAGELIPLHRAAEGETYELVVSPIGGLPRYRLGDRVRISGRHRRTPCLALVGRTGGVVDLVGEKLHPAFVDALLARLLPDATFRTLVPVLGPPARYVLLTDRASPDLPTALDAGLNAAWHHRQARLLGQLAAPEVLSGPWVAARWQSLAGARLGDVKDVPLCPRPRDALILALSAEVRSAATGCSDPL